jgi:hypothetical protein
MVAQAAISRMYAHARLGDSTMRFRNLKIPLKGPRGESWVRPGPQGATFRSPNNKDEASIRIYTTDCRCQGVKE